MSLTRVNVICYIHLWLAVGACACQASWFVWQTAPKGLHLQHGFKSQQAATADKAHPNAQGREWDKNSNKKKKKLYLRKKSFFARFFAHRTGIEKTKRNVNDRLKRKCAQLDQKSKNEMKNIYNKNRSNTVGIKKINNVKNLQNQPSQQRVIFPSISHSANYTEFHIPCLTW